jgi:hypothetical protein
MSNYDDGDDKLKAHLEELKRKHKELDNYIKSEFNNQLEFGLKTRKIKNVFL